MADERHDRVDTTGTDNATGATGRDGGAGRTGWWSRTHPTPPDAILVAAVRAARAGDVATVNRAAGALNCRGTAVADHARIARRLCALMAGRPLPRRRRSPNPRAAGWTRLHDPVPLAAIRAAVDDAAGAGDVATLRSALNAFEKRGAPRAARLTRRLLLFVEAEAIANAYEAEQAGQNAG